MAEFFSALGAHVFMQNAVLAALLSSVACGVVGSFVVARRLTYLAGGIAHSVLGGMGLAHYLSVTQGWPWLHPIYGAVVAALIAAVIIGWVNLRASEREDTVIGAIWAIGMAVGILFISQTPGYNQELMSYLFGNILMVDGGRLWLVAGLDVVILVVVALMFNRFVAVCFDEEFARVRGLNVNAHYLTLLALTALTVVTLVMVVGIVLVIALLTIPAAIAFKFSHTISRSAVVATIVCMILTVLGLAISYEPNLPAGATIIVVSGLAYLIVTGIASMRRRVG